MQKPSGTHRITADILKAYLQIFPDERERLRLLLQQMADGGKLNDRRNFRGHVTGSAIVLSPDRTKILLVYHKLFKAWQQPGGHWESDEEPNPLEVAKRETEEETGIRQMKLLSIDSKNPFVPLHINSHPVPPQPRRDEPAHYHHDFRYAFVVANTKLQNRPEEINIADVGWFALDDPDTRGVKTDIAKLKRFGFLDN